MDLPIIASSFLKSMSSKKYQEKAIQLVSVNSHGQLVLQAEAVAFLRSLTPPISIVSVSGPTQTGKSFLLNQILSHPNAFSTAHSSSRTTKGLWLWSKPLLAYNSQGKIASVILIDSEGFDEQSHDKRLTTLALLFSNCLLYNSVGPIDRDSLFELEQLMELCRILQNKQKNSDSDFHWVLRNFDYQLVNQFGIAITPKQYLENCLLEYSDRQLQPTVETFKTYFPVRNCHCLVEPNLEGEQHPEFLENVIDLRKIFNGIKSENMDGSSLIIILQAYIEALNNEDSLQKVFQQGNDCKTRLSCLDKLNDELKGLQQSPNDMQDIQQKLLDIRTNLKEYYKQRMSSHKQIQVLDEQLNEILMDFQEVNELKPYASIRSISRSKQNLLQIPQQKAMRVSLHVSEADRNDQTYPSLSLNRISTSKTLQNKLEEFQTKVYRYELEANCCRKEMDTLRNQYEKSRKQLQIKSEEIEELTGSCLTKQKQYQSRIYEQSQTIMELKRQNIIAESQLDKLKQLNAEKVQYLEAQLRELTECVTKEKQEKEQKFRSKMNEYFKEIEELKLSHLDQIQQLKTIYKSSNEKLSDSNHGQITDTFYRDMKEQIEIIQKLKDQNEKARYSKLQLENTLKILKSRLENKEEYIKDYTEQLAKRSRETEKYLESLYEAKLTSKQNIIEELQARIQQLSRTKEEKEVTIDRVLQIKVSEIADLQHEIAKRNLQINQLIAQRNNFKKDIEQFEYDHAEDKARIRKFMDIQLGLEDQIRKLKDQVATLKSINEKARCQFEEIITENQNLISEFRAQLENERQERQFLSIRNQSHLNDVKGMYQAEKSRMQQRIEQLNQQIEDYRRMQLNYQDLQLQSTQTQFLLKQTLDGREKELQKNKYELAQLKRELNELQLNHKTIIQERDNTIREYEENLEEAAEELDMEKQQEESRYNALQQKLYQKEKECIMLLAKFQKENRTAALKEKEWQSKVEKMRTFTQKKEESSNKDKQRLEESLKMHQQQNSQLTSKLALLHQKITFLEESLTLKVADKSSQVIKMNEKLAKTQNKYTELIRIKDNELQSLKRRLNMYLKQRQISIQNLDELETKSRMDQRRYESHLNLFHTKLEQLKLQNTQLRQILQQYRQDYSQLRSTKQTLSHNYSKDTILWGNKLSICQQKMLSLRPHTNLARQK